MKELIPSAMVLPALPHHLDQICNRFEAVWKAARAGEPRPRLEEFLTGAAELERRMLLIELLGVEVGYRRQLGETPALEEYQQRFPEVPPDLLADELVVKKMRAGEEPWDLTLAHPEGVGERALVTQGPLFGINLPGYEILGELGRGGMGVVYKARDVKLNRVVALKVILAGSHADSQQLVRFLAEAEVVAQLQHAHLVPIFEIGRHNDLPYFTLEYVSGGNLAQKLQGMPFPPAAAARMAEQLAHGVHAAHRHGIVHRDLKPANILLAEDGTPKITDFGLAKRVQSGVGMTVTGTIMGSPPYMAPEQADGKNRAVGPAADIYALGAILYELLTGRPPFKAATALDTLLQVCTDEPVPPRQFQSKTPKDLETVCLKCLHKEPAKRYATAQALAEDLARFQMGKPVLARPVGRSERTWRWCRRNPVVAGLTGAVMLVLVLGSLVSWALTILALGEKKRADMQTELARDSNADAQAKAREARSQQAEALIAQARGIRTSHRPGQRFEALKALKEAKHIGDDLERPSAWFERLRNEVINALAMPDLHVTKAFDGLPEGTVDADLSVDFALYVHTDESGACYVRRVADNVQVARLPPEKERLALSRFIPVFGPQRLLTRWEFASRRCELWDLSPDEPVRRLDEPNAYAGFFNQDGSLFALSYYDGWIKVSSTDTGLSRFELAPTEIRREPFASLHPTLPIIAVCSYQSNLLQVRDLKSGAVLVSVRLPWRRSYPCLWSPEGRILAVSDANSGLIHLYSFNAAAAELTLRRALKGGENGGNFMNFNPAGDRMAIRGWNSQVGLFDIGTGRKLFGLPSSTVGTLRFDPTGQQLAGTRVGVLGRQIGVWSVGDSREFRILVHGGTERRYPDYFLPAVHPDGRLAVAGLKGGLALFDLETGRELHFVLEKYGGGNPCFDDAGNLFTSGLTGLYKWPVRPDPAFPGRLTIGPPDRLPFPGSNRSVDSSRDGGVIAQANFQTGGWAFQAGSEKAKLIEKGRCNWVSVSRQGKWVACGPHENGQVNVYDPATDERFWQSPIHSGSFCRFSRDGSSLLTNHDGGRALAVGTWAPGKRLGPGTPWDLSPDGHLAVVGDAEGIYRIVERATGRELARLEDPDQIAGSAVFTPDGTRLVVAGEDGLRVWDLRRIRAELARWNLDFDAAIWPPYPVLARDAPARAPLELDIAFNAQGQFIKGRDLLATDQVEGAIAAYRDAIRMDPNHMEARHYLAVVQKAHQARSSFSAKYLGGTLTVQEKHEAHELKLTADTIYIFDMESTAFDPFLKLEDAQGKLLAENDDIIPGVNLNARIVFAPKSDGTYRVVATSSSGVDVGAYSLRIRALTGNN